jgi:hypothetical protein
MFVQALAAAFLIAAPGPRGDSPPLTGPEVEVRCVDGSTLRLRVLDDKLELATRHGTLHIATADVRRIEFASRIPPADVEKIADALTGLKSGEFKVREKAAGDLTALRSRAYPAVLKATEDSDPEVAARAKAVAAAIRRKVPAEFLKSVDQDVVYTEDSKIAGKLTATTLRVDTLQFGEQRLRLADVRTLGPESAIDPFANVPAAPPSLIGYSNQFGKELTFRVYGGAAAAQAPVILGPGARGAVMLQGGGGVWGTDVYTLDSSLWEAAVHAGVVEPGKTAVVHIRIVQSPAQFTGSTRNGVPSQGYGFYNGGAFEFVTK